MCLLVVLFIGLFQVSETQRNQRENAVLRMRKRLEVGSINVFILPAKSHMRRRDFCMWQLSLYCSQQKVDDNKNCSPTYVNAC